MDSFTTWEAPSAWQRMQLQSVVQRLRQAKLLLAGGEKHLVRLRDLVRELERNGRDATPAKAALSAFETARAWHISRRDRLRKELLTLRSETMHRGAA